VLFRSFHYFIIQKALYTSYFRMTIFFILFLAVLAISQVSSFLQTRSLPRSHQWGNRINLNMQSEDGQETTVYVSNIAFSVTEDALRNILEGSLNLPVTKIAIPKDKITDRPRGFVFIDFKDHETALKAVESLNGYELSGRTLSSNLRKKDFVKGEKTFTPTQGGMRTSQPRVQESPDKTIYVSNINWTLTKVSIENMCEDLLGPNLLENVRFPIDRERGTSRGFCYITFKDPAMVEKALGTLDGVEVLGREIRAKRFEEREPSSTPRY